MVFRGAFLRQEGLLMRLSGWLLGLFVLGMSAAMGGQSRGQSTPAPADITAISPDAFNGDVPKLMAVPPDPPSVYAPVEPERPIDGTNKGGVAITLDFRYLTDDVYRGISHNFAVYNASPKSDNVDRHASNFQTDAKLQFNLDKLPHPYVGVFANVNDSDPVSRFQEIRPFAGFDYSLRPITLGAGVRTYIYPEREKNKPSPNTSEAFVRISIDDSYLFRTQVPIIQPYIEGVYDYDKNRGWYVETGVKHDFDFPDFGVTLSPYADVAWISHFKQQFITNSVHSSGFQHYDIGLTGDLSLNHLLHLPPRYGQFAVEGYLTYTSKFSNPILADTELWGGVGLVFKY
jgi:hypothetical protein